MKAGTPHQPPIAEHALIGDCETAALVDRSGTINWLCWPRFDSGACFASLLGGPEHGQWQLAPEAEVLRVERRYQSGTLVLETDIETAEGAITLVDFMPLRSVDLPTSSLVRIAIGRRGRVAMRMDLALRFHYGEVVPWVTRMGDGRLRAVAGPHAVVLQTDVPTRAGNLNTVAQFELAAGDRVSFTLTYEASHLAPPASADAESALKQTAGFWSEWSGRSRYTGPWKDAVNRSLVVIKALTYRPTGGIVAAPTTSLPEQLGGPRNWDYRYCWLRDTSFVLQSLIHAGYRQEAEAWGDWLLRAVAGTPAQVQPVYGLAGEHRLPETELDWLPGYHGSRPVRTGNQACAQLQLDAFGGAIDALFQARREGLELHEAGLQLQARMIEHLESLWQKPDEGIWEVRGEPQHFVHSKLMCWVAFDRAVRMAQDFAMPGPVDRWRHLRDTIRAEILERGFDTGLGAFTQAYGSRQLDSALLLMPLVGFLPATDERVVSTVRAIEKGLMRNGLLLRYDTGNGHGEGGGGEGGSVDGLPGGEGAFLACSFWLADNWALQGRRDDAQALFERLLALRNDVGLLAEEYDPVARRQLGNFPQAFSHFALVDTAFALQGSRPGL